jgi:hypothetical protein
MGKKESVKEPDRNGNMERKTYVNLKAVVDERICDGYDFGRGFKEMKSGFTHPERLMAPPAKVVIDEIDKR